MDFGEDYGLYCKCTFLNVRIMDPKRSSDHRSLVNISWYISVLSTLSFLLSIQFASPN